MLPEVCKEAHHLVLGHQSHTCAAALFNQVAATVRQSMMTYLWQPGGDHFCTQVG
jgi:hypothetical protein